jgi:hypothetical protein
MKHNIAFFAESIVPDLVEYLCQESRRKTLRGITVYLGNARPHDSRRSEVQDAIAPDIRRNRRKEAPGHQCVQERGLDQLSPRPGDPSGSSEIWLFQNPSEPLE